MKVGVGFCFLAFEDTDEDDEEDEEDEEDLTYVTLVSDDTYWRLD